MLAKFYTSNLNDSGKSPNFGVVIDAKDQDTMIMEVVLSDALAEKSLVLVPSEEIEFSGLGCNDPEFNTLYDRVAKGLYDDIIFDDGFDDETEI